MSSASPNILYRLLLYDITYVFPPETYKTVGCLIPVTKRPISTCAIQWLIPTIGISWIKDNVLATSAPYYKGGPIPGPLV